MPFGTIVLDAGGMLYPSVSFEKKTVSLAEFLKPFFSFPKKR
jgi:hypothetical protein